MRTLVLLSLLGGCPPKVELGHPLPAAYAPTAVAYRTTDVDPAALAPLEALLADGAKEQATAVGVRVRLDQELVTLARVLAYQLATTGVEPTAPGVATTAAQVGVASPLLFYGWSTRDRRDPNTEAWAGALDGLADKGRVAVGVGAWDDRKNRTATSVLVIADDRLRLTAPVFKDNPEAIRGRFDGSGDLSLVTSPPVVATPVEPAGGQFTVQIPNGAVRADLVETWTDGAEWATAASFDFTGAGAPPPLPAGQDDASRLFAALNAMRHQAGLDPLHLVSGLAPCASWPPAIDGRPVMAEQRCFHRVGDKLDVEASWTLYGSRPAFAWMVDDPAADLVVVSPENPFGAHVFRSFEQLSPDEGRDRALAILAARWPDAVVDTTAQPAFHGAAAVGSRPAEGSQDQALAALKAIPRPFATEARNRIFAVFGASTWDTLAEQMQDVEHCQRYGLGYAQGPGPAGWWHHVVTLVCEP